LGSDCRCQQQRNIDRQLRGSDDLRLVKQCHGCIPGRRSRQVCRVRKCSYLDNTRCKGTKGPPSWCQQHDETRTVMRPRWRIAIASGAHRIGERSKIRKRQR
jgi:hypothetical protein